MRLVVFGSGHPYRGGVARTTTEMVAALEKRNHDVLYLTPRRQYPGWLFPGATDRDPAACRRLRCAESFLEPMNPLAWAAGRRLAMNFAADAWIVPYWTWAWAGWWRFLLREPRPPAVAVVHNPVDHDSGWLQRRAARGVLEQCQALFTHAESLQNLLAEAYPGVPTASHVFPPISVGEPPDRRATPSGPGTSQNIRTALFLGLVRPYKGVDLLVQAFAGLPEDSNWRLVVAGEPWGDLEEQLRRQVRESGRGDRICLDLRWVPENELPGLLAAADLVVLPYRAGSQSAVAPIALAAGLPVLSTDVGGVSEIVRHGVDGWIVEAGSADALTAALVEIQGPVLDRLTHGAVEGRNRLSWNGYAEALEALTTAVVAGGWPESAI